MFTCEFFLNDGSNMIYIHIILHKINCRLLKYTNCISIKNYKMQSS